MRGWQNGRIRTLANKKKPGCRSLGCRLQVGGAKNGLLAIKLQNFKTPFGVARPYEQFKVLGVLVQRCDACQFILNEAARNSALALH
jgi:hypothetical protein